MVQMKKHKIYEAELIQPACPFCGSLDLLHNGHLITNIRYPTANASLPVIIRLAKQRVKCRDCDHWSMAQSELVNKYCSISNASKLKVLSALTEDRSMTSIARENMFRSIPSRECWATVHTDLLTATNICQLI